MGVAVVIRIRTGLLCGQSALLAIVTFWLLTESALWVALALVLAGSWTALVRVTSRSIPRDPALAEAWSALRDILASFARRRVSIVVDGSFAFILQRRSVIRFDITDLTTAERSIAVPADRFALSRFAPVVLWEPQDGRGVIEDHEVLLSVHARRSAARKVAAPLRWSVRLGVGVTATEELAELCSQLRQARTKILPEA